MTSEQLIDKFYRRQTGTSRGREERSVSWVYAIRKVRIPQNLRAGPTDDALFESDPALVGSV